MDSADTNLTVGRIIDAAVTSICDGGSLLQILRKSYLTTDDDTLCVEIDPAVVGTEIEVDHPVSATETVHNQTSGLRPGYSPSAFVGPVRAYIHFTCTPYTIAGSRLAKICDEKL